MLSWIKYVIIIMCFVVALVFIYGVSLRHQSNITDTQLVDTGVDSVSVGEVREGVDTFVYSEELLSNLMVDIIDRHTEQERRVRVSFVLLDGTGSGTIIDSQVRSVQFQVELLGENGDVESISRERIEFDKD